MAASTSKRGHDAWLIAAVLAEVLGAQWLRTWYEPYLVACAAAIALCALVWWRWSGAGIGRFWWGVTTIALAAFALVGWRAEREFDRIQTDWAAYERERVRIGAEALRDALRRDFAALQESALRSLDIPDGTEARFAQLEAALPPASLGERSSVVFGGTRPFAWMGPVRIAADSLHAAVGVVSDDFYLVAYATAVRGERRAVVMRTLLARPPADRLARGATRVLAAQTGLRDYEIAVTPQPDWLPVGTANDTLAWIRPLGFGQGAARLRMEETSRLRGTLALFAALLASMALAWRAPAPAWRRLAALGVALTVVALLPINALSNRSPVFDPSYFFTPLGGAFTASVGALALTSALVLLGVFFLLRTRARLRSRGVAAVVVLIVAAVGPFLLRDLARGIAPPPRGVPTTLWIAWEVALFLAASAVLLMGAIAGRAVVRQARGVPPAIAPLLAAAGALIGPIVWQAPGRWPFWYPIPWIVAMVALALARRSRAFVLHSALVAACGATTLVWGAVSRKRVELAERDVAGLSQADPESQRLLERFADDLRGAAAPPHSRIDLLRQFVVSDLAASGNPIELSAWRAGSTRPDAELVVEDFARREAGERDIVADADSSGRPVIRAVASPQGIQSVLAAPIDSGWIVSVVVAPRTRLIAEDPFSTLLGLEAPSIVEPPYRLAVAPVAMDATLAAHPRWERKGDEMHGDWRIGGADGFVRAHVEVDLRGIDALVQRGALLVLVDLLVLAALWTLSAAADGVLWRWLRFRARGWRRSYRTRLTLALFGAFVFPAAAFAIWTYRRLQSEDRLSRELLVRETLRAVAASSDVGRLREEGDRLDTPLFLYEGGWLSRTSDELYDALLPLGRYLDPVAAQSVALGDEVVASRRLTIGGVPTLVGYRVLLDTGHERIILAAPARRNEMALERPRRDLVVLVSFATVLGALAALWLSGLTARGFARPIGALREAALAVAGGARQTGSLGETPLYEFRPVYSAFRQMVHDLGESRDALEAAQRRTEAVLRNVASGVVAFDAQGRITLTNAQAERVLAGGGPLAAGTTLDRAGAEGLHTRVIAFLSDHAEDDGFDLPWRGRQLRARLTRLASGSGGVVLTLDDVTDLVRAQRVFAWGEMARQVAHEIKNPLTPIRLGVQHLRRARADRRDDFDLILERNIRRILEEIDRLDEIARAFSKYGTAPGERQAGEPTDVVAVARDVVALERMGESAVEWTLEGDTEPVLAMASAGELREVMLNLLENARNAHSRQVVTRIVRDGDRVVILVIDDGVGIAADVLPRVFEPHFSTRTSGSGLGLAISRRFVESWGGSIQLTRREAAERGTVARLALVPAAAT